jgi:N-acetylneuraminate synthase
MSVFIIAEAGVNHNGDPAIALQLVDAAAAAGADAVKFQTFSAKKVVTTSAKKAAYQKQTTGANENQLSMLQKLELPQKLHFQLADYCQDKGIQFLSTAFDFDSLTFLVDEVKVERLKLPSGEITNGPFLLAHAQTGKEIILSTGMASLDEIETALGVLAFGYLGLPVPSLTAFPKAYKSQLGQSILREKITLLHCTTAYPTPLCDINLRAIYTMTQTFGLPVGYSDHSEGITVSVAAVACGATLIEKHFTLDRDLPGPDHKASLEPHELKAMVEAIREVEQALGDGIKAPRPSELANKETARRSLVAATEIKQGDLFTDNNITAKRPGAGRSPMEYWDILGSPSSKDYKSDSVIN